MPRGESRKKYVSAEAVCAYCPVIECRTGHCGKIKHKQFWRRKT